MDVEFLMIKAPSMGELFWMDNVSIPLQQTTKRVFVTAMLAQIVWILRMYLHSGTHFIRIGNDPRTTNEDPYDSFL